MFPFGSDGFLGTRASLMLDLVALAMVAVLPVLGWSVWQVRRGRYLVHKRTQLALAVVLGLAVIAFEADMRFFTDWRARANPSPFYGTWVMPSLWIHLFFSVSTTLLWACVVVGALRNIPNPPSPSAYSPKHKFWARLAAIDLVLTAITGWIFYWLAFVAR